MKKINRVFAYAFLILFALVSYAGAAASLFNYPKFHAQTAAGVPLSGGLVYTYSPGTSTPKATYSDVGLTTPNANPVVLDASGDATIYMNGLYKVILKNSAGVTQWTMDNIGGIESAWSMYEVDALNVYGDGVNYTQATIASALTAIGTVNKTTLLLRPGTWVISTDADYSAYTNVTWKVVPGALLQIASGKTLTINGPFEAGLYQVFSGDGTVLISNSAIKRRPEWWGIDGINDEVQINAAINAGSGTVDVSGGSYKVGASIIPKSLVDIIGDSSTLFDVKANSISVFATVGTTATSRFTLSHLTIVNTASHTGVIGFEMNQARHNVLLDKLYTNDIETGFWIHNLSWNTHIRNSSAFNGTYGFLVTDDANALVLENSRAITMSNSGFYIYKGAGTVVASVTIQGGLAQASTSYGVYVGDGARSITIRDMYFESNSAADIYLAANAKSTTIDGIYAGGSTGPAVIKGEGSYYTKIGQVWLSGTRGGSAENVFDFDTTNIDAVAYNHNTSSMPSLGPDVSGLTLGPWTKEFYKTGSGLDDTIAIAITFNPQATRYIGSIVEIWAALSDDGGAVSYSSIVRYSVASYSNASPSIVANMTHDLIGGVTQGTAVTNNVLTVTLTMPGAVAIDRYSVWIKQTAALSDGLITGVTIN